MQEKIVLLAFNIACTPSGFFPCLKKPLISVKIEPVPTHTQAKHTNYYPTKVDHVKSNQLGATGRNITICIHF